MTTASDVLHRDSDIEIKRCSKKYSILPLESMAQSPQFRLNEPGTLLRESIPHDI